MRKRKKEIGRILRMILIEREISIEFGKMVFVEYISFNSFNDRDFSELFMKI